MKKEALLYEKLADDRVHCCLCPHNCKIDGSQSGLCGVRKNENGILYTYNYANPVALNVDPIEKKPLYHFLPSTKSFSIAAYGCNLKCSFCQNWQISQVSLEGVSCNDMHEGNPVSIVELAKENFCKSISYTYTEPTVFFEYAYDCAKLARERDLYNIFVTNGYMNPETAKIIIPYLNAANIDIKSFSENFYQRLCGGHLSPVLDTIKLLKGSGVWVEITTLLIPGENDSQDELEDIAGFIADTGRDIPWHISRYHPAYRYKEAPVTPVDTLMQAVDTGKKAGLKYVYTGNISEGNDTCCSECGKLLIKRSFCSVSEYNIDGNKCSGCGAEVDGVFN